MIFKSSYTGLCDVVGGKMWFCISPEGTKSVLRFWTKKECEDFIRASFNDSVKRTLLASLRTTKGRAVMYH